MLANALHDHVPAAVPLLTRLTITAPLAATVVIALPAPSRIVNVFDAAVALMMNVGPPSESVVASGRFTDLPEALIVIDCTREDADVSVMSTALDVEDAPPATSTVPHDVSVPSVVRYLPLLPVCDGTSSAISTHDALVPSVVTYLPAFPACPGSAEENASASA